MNELKSEEWSKRMIETVITKFPRINKKWSYENGVLFKGIESAWSKNRDIKYINYIKNNMDLLVNEKGDIFSYHLEEYNIDHINNGKTLLFLYKQTADEKYKKAADFLRSQLKTHPRTSDGGFWHKKIYPHQMWLDGLYMGSPFLAEYGLLFNEPEVFDDVARQLILMDKHSRDRETGLHFHGWDESRNQEWADKESGCSRSFWSRAEGWYAMALVDVLDYLPHQHKERNKLIEILNSLIKALETVQDKDTGVWNQVLDYSAEKGNYPEASSSAMFTYAISKAVKKEYIESHFLEIAKQSYRGIIKHFVVPEPDNQLSYINTVRTSGLGQLGNNPYRDGTFEYYVSCPVEKNSFIGIGAFILASVEMENL